MINLANFPKTRPQMFNLLLERTFLTDGMKRWREQVEVFRSVIILFPIYMMHVLIRGKAAAKHLLHYHAMLSYITSLISPRVIVANQNVYISISSSQTTTFPPRAFFTAAGTSWRSPFITTSLDIMTSHGIDHRRWTATKLPSYNVNALFKSLILIAKPCLITQLWISFLVILHSLHCTIHATFYQLSTVLTVRGYRYA